MNFTPNDNPVLIAPRPVRIPASSFFSRIQPTRLVSAPPDVSDQISPISECISPFESAVVPESSPRATSRSGPSSEALEEFLSILKPSFFPPRSPVLRAPRAGYSLPNFSPERGYPFRVKSRLELIPSRNDTSEADDVSRSANSSRCTNRSLGPDETYADDVDDDLAYRGWFSTNVLSSPISRSNTRNPFQRHHTYSNSQSPNTQMTTLVLSPAAIPLPLPTADEMTEVA